MIPTPPNELLKNILRTFFVISVCWLLSQLSIELYKEFRAEQIFRSRGAE